MVEFVLALRRLYGPEAREGQGLVEYGLAIVLIAIAVITLLGLTGGAINDVFSKITTSLTGSGL